VLHLGIHKIGTLDEDGVPRVVANLPLPDRIEIEMEAGRQDPCMMIRYADDGRFGGDTWHENLEAAFAQAEYEYGLVESDCKRSSDPEVTQP